MAATLFDLSDVYLAVITTNVIQRNCEHASQINYPRGEERCGGVGGVDFVWSQFGLQVRLTGYICTSEDWHCVQFMRKINYILSSSPENDTIPGS
jgi:hypothetical protein